MTEPAVFPPTATPTVQSTSLVSVDDFVQAFNLGTLSTGEADRVQNVLDIVSAAIRSGRRRFDAVDDDVVTITGISGSGRTISLPKDRLPVRGVTKVEQLGRGDTEYTTADAALYDWDEAGIIYLDCSAGWWTARLRGVRVTYDHGYLALPADVAGVCLAYAKRLYDNPAGSSIRSETLGDRSVTYEAGGLLSDESMILRQYEVLL